LVFLPAVGKFAITISMASPRGCRWIGNIHSGISFVGQGAAPTVSAPPPGGRFSSSMPGCLLRPYPGLPPAPRPALGPPEEVCAPHESGGWNYARLETLPAPSSPSETGSLTGLQAGGIPLTLLGPSGGGRHACSSWGPPACRSRTDVWLESFGPRRRGRFHHGRPHRRTCTSFFQSYAFVSAPEPGPRQHRLFSALRMQRRPAVRIAEAASPRRPSRWGRSTGLRKPTTAPALLRRPPRPRVAPFAPRGPKGAGVRRCLLLETNRFSALDCRVLPADHHLEVETACSAKGDTTFLCCPRTTMRAPGAK